MLNCKATSYWPTCSTCLFLTPTSVSKNDVSKKVIKKGHQKRTFLLFKMNVLKTKANYRKGERINYISLNMSGRANSCPFFIIRRVFFTSSIETLN